jgi:hypothetical protein
MISENKPQTAMPVIAGVLILVSEGFKLLILLLVFIGSFIVIVPSSISDFNPGIILPLIIIPFLAAAAIAVIGGIFAIQRHQWGWALAGSIIATLPFSIFGLAAVILLALSKEEFS